MLFKKLSGFFCAQKPPPDFKKNKTKSHIFNKWLLITGAPPPEKKV